jgi:hypothetical protein
MASITGLRRRNALSSNDLLKQLPSPLRENHFKRETNQQKQPPKAIDKVELIKVPVRRSHFRSYAMNWIDFTETMMFKTPTLGPPGAPHFIRFTNKHNGSSAVVDSPSSNINELLSELSNTGTGPDRKGELSSLEYSDSSSDEESSVPECVESAIVKSVAVALDFSLIEKNMECAICLESPKDVNYWATLSGCHHSFCFEVS